MGKVILCYCVMFLKNFVLYVLIPMVLTLVILLCTWIITSSSIKKTLNFHCFINKDKHIKKTIATNMESLVYNASKQVNPSCGYTDIFSKNVLSTNDETKNFEKPY